MSISLIYDIMRCSPPEGAKKFVDFYYYMVISVFKLSKKDIVSKA